MALGLWSDSARPNRMGMTGEALALLQETKLGLY